jgi:hypothetical protein
MVNVLPSFKVIDHWVTEQGNYQVFVESVTEPKACIKCGCNANLYKWGSKQQLLMDNLMDAV